ncbi:hypothetical protein LCGC14_2204110 [marine sediment metagenome]|uniref:Uncharacterized protein n=1 Tax=marine sediment metagenome TaxID=412755 RepID=A0A0F9DFZ6_9ZZZZ
MDRPELRDGFLRIVARIWGEDCDSFDEDTLESAMYWVYEMEALLPNEEEIRKQMMELDEGFKQMHQEAIKEAKREERERIIELLEDVLEDKAHLNYRIAGVYGVIQALKEEE